MRSVGNRETSVLDRRCWWALCAAWGIMLVLTFGDSAMGCNARSVKMFVATTEALAETSSDKSLSLCEDTSYYVRVEWSEGGSDEEFDVEVREEVDGGSEEIASESGIDDEETSPQSTILLVNTTPYANALDAGKHSIYGRVRRVGLGWEPEANTDDSNSTVYQFAGLTWLVQKEAGVWRSVNAAVCKGESVQFKAIPNPIELEDEDFPAGYPEWGDEADSQPDGTNPVTLTFNELGTKTVSVQACGTNTQLSVYVKEALFFEDTSYDYGFDDWSNSDEPWKSVKQNFEDTALAKTVKTPVTSLYFRSSNTTNVQLKLPDPPHASGSPETIKVKGLVDNGESDIEANWGSVGGTNLAKMKVRVYDEETKTVKVHRVRRNAGESFDWPFTESGLASYLNQVFSQCAISFTVDFHDDWDTVNYDTVTVDDALTHGTTEKDSITPFADGSSDFNLFIVIDIKESDGSDLGGFAESPGSHAFMECCGYQPLATAAHELAHALGGLDDIEDKYEDDENLMSRHSCDIGGLCKWRLRKEQWNDCNP